VRRKCGNANRNTREKGISWNWNNDIPSMSFLLLTEVADECGESAGLEIEIRGKKGSCSRAAGDRFLKSQLDD